MEFERSSRRLLTLPLTALIDVVFILIIFFMLTSSFMRIESLELMLPSSTSKTAEKTDVLRLFVSTNGDMQLGNRPLAQQELEESLTRVFEKDPNTRVMVLTADGVTMQQLVNVMDRIYMSGGKSLFVRKWVGAK
jgi:biopolymer transport protein ExbD